MPPVNKSTTKSVGQRIRDEMNDWKYRQSKLKKDKTKKVVIRNGDTSEFILSVTHENVVRSQQFSVHLLNALQYTKEALLVGALSAKTQDDIRALLAFVHKRQLEAIEVGVKDDVVDRVNILPMIESMEQSPQPDVSKLTPSFATGLGLLNALYPSLHRKGVRLYRDLSSFSPYSRSVCVL